MLHRKEYIIKKLCIFDLDGTLMNTINTISYYGNMALAHNSLPPIKTSIYKILVGNGSKTLVERMLAYIDSPNYNIDKVLNIYTKIYDKEPYYLTEIYDGILDLLLNLKKCGIKLAVLSNKDDSTTVKVIKEFFPFNTFDIIIGHRDDLELKPSPDGVFEIMHRCNVVPNEVLYIGDTHTDMLTGNAANVDTVGVLWGFRDRNELSKAADIIVSQPSEILDIAKES